MEQEKMSTVTIDYELFAGFKISQKDFDELEEQIQKICERHDGKRTVRISVKNWYGRN